jgi:hypothetical protein
VTEILHDVVRDAGYLPTVEDDRVCFRSEGTRFWFETYEDDRFYTRLILTYVTPEDAEIYMLLAAANDRNRVAKAVKTVVFPRDDEGYVRFSIEAFNTDGAWWGETLERAMISLRSAAETYFEEVRAMVAT